MKKFAFHGAAVWAIGYSILIFLILTANITPDFKSGVNEAIISTIRLMAIFAIGLVGQLGFQIALAGNREENLSTGEKWYDGVTTLMPLATVGFTSWWMSGMAAKVAWWPTLSRWVFWLALLGTLIDLYNGWRGIKIWSGRAHGAHAAPAAHPPAAHPPAGGAAHP